MKKDTAKILLLLMIPHCSIFPNVPEIAALTEIHTGYLKELRTEIAQNLKSVSRRRKTDTELRFFKYIIKKDDKFYPMIARFSQDEDTVSSLNGIIHPADIEPGQVIYIPNARGLFVKKDALQNPNAEYAIFVRHPGTGEDIIFLPGQKKDPEERSLFRGEGYLFPVPEGIRSSGFGMRKDPFSGRMVFHGGIDIAAPEGTPVLASRSGKVSFSDFKGGYGKLVAIDHSFGYETLYGHLSEILVKEGDTVRKGDIIGYVGSTGRSTGPHLHFEVRKNGKKIRPELR